jgi:Cu-Zn family superoxide dismutase
MKATGLVMLALASAAIPDTQAEDVTIEMYRIDDSGVGAPIGKIMAHDSSQGMMLMPLLKGLPPGPHGFHVHEYPDCGAKEKDGKMVAGLAAGNHFDPKNTAKHAGPMGGGHLGDLPVLVVEPDGSAKGSVTAGRLKVADIKSRSLMIHAETDNYADKAGGPRIACGVVK